MFLAPALVVLGVFFVGSFAEVVRASVTNANAFTEPEFVGLSNYERLLGDARFWTCLRNSFVYLLVTPVVLVLSLACALVIDARVRGSGWLRVVYFLPVVTPTIVASVAWRVLFNEETGLLNGVLSAVGALTGGAIGPVGWLTSFPWTLVSAMIVTTWKGFGFYMMIFLAGLTAVPRELKEAASIDGAGGARVFAVVTLPALWPTVTLVSVISSIAALKVFDELYVTVRGAPVSHQTAVPLVYRTAFEENAFGAACAAGVMLFVVILAFSAVNLWLTGGRGDRGRA